MGAYLRGTYTVYYYTYAHEPSSRARARARYARTECRDPNACMGVIYNLLPPCMSMYVRSCCESERQCASECDLRARTVPIAAGPDSTDAAELKRPSLPRSLANDEPVRAGMDVSPGLLGIRVRAQLGVGPGLGTCRRIVAGYQLARASRTLHPVALLCTALDDRSPRVYSTQGACRRVGPGRVV
jgi:hypothetical protein